MDLFISLPLLTLLAIIIQSFFSNSEMAMISANRIRINYLKKNGNKKAKIISGFINNPDKLFATTLIGINFSAIIATKISHYFFEYELAHSYHFIEKFVSIEILTIIIVEPLILIFGELYPMSIARKYPTHTSLRNASLIRVSYFIFFPLLMIVSSTSKLLTKLFNVDGETLGKINRDELQLLVSGKVSQITDKTRKIIQDVFDISKLNAIDIMVHLNEVKSISSSATVGELKELIKDTNFSRFPVYEDNIFNIIATIHAVSILGADDNECIMQYSEKLYIVPSSKPVIQILSDLKRNRKYMGITVDEYGVVCGIITIENIAVELIGEIHDESDFIVENIIKEENVFEGKTYLDDFFEKTGIDLRGNNVETLGGIINIAIGRIARKGDLVYFKDTQFEVLEATDRYIKKIKLLSAKRNKK